MKTAEIFFFYFNEKCVVLFPLVVSERFDQWSSLLIAASNTHPMTICYYTLGVQTETNIHLMEDFFRARARTRIPLHRPNVEDLITACSRLCLRQKKAKEKLISAHTIFRFIEQLAGGHKNSFIKWSTLSLIHKTSELIWVMARPSLCLWCQFNLKKPFFSSFNRLRLSERQMFLRRKWTRDLPPPPKKNNNNFSRSR